MSKLRLIQCGVGGMGRTWWTRATNRADDFDLVALVDISDAALAEAGEATNVPTNRRFKSLEAALKDVSADAVLTVTPPAVHVQHARVAFEHGLHLLTEKPIADTLDNAKLMVKLAADANRQLAVTQNYRYKPEMRALKKLATEQPVGSVGHGHLDFYIPADFTGSFRETMEYPLLVDMAVHHLDLVRFITGRNIRKVTALSFRPDWSWYQHDPGLKMLLELEDGLPFSYSGDWSAMGKSTGWSGNWRLQCASGSLHIEQDKVYLAKCEKWMKNPACDEIPVRANPELSEQAQLLKDFAQAIRTDKPAPTSGADNLQTFAAVMAGVTSAREKRPVEVSEMLGS